MFGAIRQAITQPDSFFEERATETGLSTPVLIVTVLGLLYLGSGYLSTYVYFAGANQLLGMFGGFLAAFLMWLWVTVGFQFVSYFFDGSGSFRRMAALVGWGFLPLLIGGTIQLVATAIAFGNPTPPAAVYMNGQAVVAIQQPQSDPLVQAGRVVRLVTTLWSGYVWVFAVEHTRGLTRQNATITVGIVLAITLGYSVFTTLLV